MAKGPEIPKTDSAEIEILIERLKQNKLEQRDVELIERLLRTVMALVNLLQRKNMSIKRLRDLIFGRRTEKRKTGSVSQPEDKPEEGAGADPGAEREESEKSQRQRQAGPQGHGRRATAQYRGAKKVECWHEQYQAGAKCPEAACPGRLYDTRRPNLFIQFRGQPILEGVVFEREVLRCSACQERYVASLPEEVSETRYEASADVAIVVAKYGAKLPFYRLAQMQESCGVPVSESVMFERSEQVADRALPVYLALKQEAANGEVIHTDDTPVKILSCLKEDREEEAERRATNTSGIVVKTTAGHMIALYASGRRHAGENLDQLLEGRAEELGPPIQMADALAAIGRGSARGLLRSVGRMRGESSSKSRRVSPSPVAWCWRRSEKSTAMKPRREVGRPEIGFCPSIWNFNTYRGQENLATFYRSELRDKAKAKAIIEIPSSILTGLQLCRSGSAKSRISGSVKSRIRFQNRQSKYSKNDHKFTNIFHISPPVFK